MRIKTLTALPVYNEVRHVACVLDEACRHSQEVLVVDDGSTDGTSDLLALRRDIRVVTHPTNRGYGAALASAFAVALRGDYDVLVTMDCDGQHQPRQIDEFIRACIDREADVVSGSRYLAEFAGDSAPPEQRLRINRTITAELNARLGLSLTDAFCGFKAYRVPMLSKFDLTEPGYAMPLELWAQAVDAGMKIVELPVHRIYLEEARSFGGALDNADVRLAVYRDVLARSIARMRRRPPANEAAVAAGACAGCHGGSSA